MQKCLTVFAIFGFILIFTAGIFAQSATANLRGIVTDANGAVVPGASVKLSRPATGEVKTLTANDEGQYSFTSLQPGDYVLEVQGAGFKTYRRTDLKLDVGENADVNVALEVGEASAEVTVNANSELKLETSSGSLGGVIEQQRVENLPLNGRNLLQLASLEPGVANTAESRADFPSGQQAGSFSINGGRGLTNEITFDGITAVNKADNVPAFRASPSAIQEFRVQTSTYAAEFGRSGGGQVSFVTRSGTKDFRGSLYEFFRNESLDANNFFANRNGTGKEKLRAHQFGFNFGGPIYLPKFGEGGKVFEKSDKLFFFFNYEGLRRRQTDFNASIVPTEKQRSGDFSELLGPTIAGVTVRDTNGNLIPARVGMIFVPGATVPVGQPGAGSRIAYAGNIIPLAQQDPVARAILAYYPLPNAATTFSATNANPSNNYFVNSPREINTNQFVTRIDYKISPTQLFYTRLIFERNEDITLGPLPTSIASRSTSGIRSDKPGSVALDYVNTLSSKMVFHFNGGWTRFNTDNLTKSNGFDPAALGFPAYLANASGDSKVFPTITFSSNGYANLGPPNQFGNTFNVQDTFTFSGDLNIVRGAHTIKTGANYRLFTIYRNVPDDPAGNFTFTRTSTARSNTLNATTTGDALASFLLGQINTGRVAISPQPSIKTSYIAAFIQDDWRVNSRLTLNLGLRWESDFPTRDRYDQLTNFLPDASFPVSSITIPTTSSTGAALPAGIAGLVRPLVGRVSRVDDSVNSEQQERDLNNFGPRFGFAYKINDKTVLRGGGVVFYSSLVGGGIVNTNYAVFGLAETGFVSGTLSNPFPSGIAQPAAFTSNFGYGQATVRARLRNVRQPQIIQWNLTVQRELPGNLFVDLSYAGSSGIGLLSQVSELNQLSPQALALGAAVLDTTVNNPFLSLPADQRPAASSILGTPTIRLAQLLRPYPQFGNVFSYYNNEAHSSYHSGQIKVARRVRNGLTFQAAYTFSKLIDDISTVTGNTGVQTTNYQDANNRRADKALSNFDSRHRFVANMSWELPFGKDKMFFREGVLSKIFSGFRLNAITQYQGGFPLGMTIQGGTGLAGLSFVSGALRPNINGSARIEGDRTVEQQIAQWFNTSVFSAPPPYTFGNSPRNLSDVRGPSYFATNMSLQRAFKFSERQRLELTAEAFNVFNQVNFRDPGTNASTATFGVITSAEPPRRIQLVLKYFF